MLCRTAKVHERKWKDQRKQWSRQEMMKAWVTEARLETETETPKVGSTSLNPRTLGGLLLASCLTGETLTAVPQTRMAHF